MGEDPESQERDMADLESLTVNECWERLRSRRVGRIGFDRGRGKRIYPVDYTVDSGAIHLTTSRNSELGVFSQLFAQGAFVSFEIDQLEGDVPEQWSVMVLARIRPQDLKDATGGRHEDGPRPPVGHDELLLQLIPLQVTGRRRTDSQRS